MAELVRITAVGDKALMDKLRSLGPKAFQEAKRVIYQKAEVIAGKAKEEVPVDTGALRSSIHVELDEGPESVSASIVAGGPAAEYAVYVHEDLTARHPVGGPKFIERPVLEVAPTIAPAILKAIDKVAKGK